jgi:hypothetical protein
VKVDPKLGGPWKEKEKVPMFGGQWKEKEKVPMFGGQWKEKEKVPMLGGQWEVPSLVANVRLKKNPFHLFLPSPQLILLKPSIFPFDLKVLFYHGSRPLFMHFLLFLDL